MTIILRVACVVLNLVLGRRLRLQSTLERNSGGQSRKEDKRVCEQVGAQLENRILASEPGNVSAEVHDDFNSSEKVGKYTFFGDILGGRYRKAVDSDGRAYIVHTIDSSRIFEHYEGMQIEEGLKHPNILRLLDSMNDGSKHYYVFEHESGRTLADVVFDKAKYDQLTIEDVQDLFEQMIDGLEHIHAHGIVHRDFTLDNMILDDSTPPKLKIFGFQAAHRLGAEDVRKRRCYLTQALAPEVLTRQGYRAYGPEADVWSAGVVLYQLLFRAFPFDHSLDNLLRGMIRYERPKIPEFEDDTPPVRYAKELVRGILNKVPAKRMTIAQMRASDFLVHSRRGQERQMQLKHMFETQHCCCSDVDGTCFWYSSNHLRFPWIGKAGCPRVRTDRGPHCVANYCYGMPSQEVCFRTRVSGDCTLSTKEFPGGRC